MQNIPWPLWMLAGFFTLCVLAGGAVHLALEAPSWLSLLEWAVSGTFLAAIGSLWFRWLSRARRPFDERWAERTEDGSLDIWNR